MYDPSDGIPIHKAILATNIQWVTAVNVMPNISDITCAERVVL